VPEIIVKSHSFYVICNLCDSDMYFLGYRLRIFKFFLVLATCVPMKFATEPGFKFLKFFKAIQHFQEIQHFQDFKFYYFICC
jgi:hypothetical protein